MMHDTKYKTFYDIFTQNKTIFTDLTLMFFSVFLLGVLSNIRIPLWPVPITMQTFGVFLIAFFFGSKKGTLTMILYIVLGLLGFGIFSGYNSGIAALLGPTGGYLLGFVFMSHFIGKMIEKGHGRTKTSVLNVMLLGNIILYTFGLAGLYLFLGNVTLWQLFSMGLLPFIVGDILKIIAAVSIFPKIWKIRR